MTTSGEGGLRGTEVGGGVWGGGGFLGWDRSSGGLKGGKVEDGLN